MKTISCLDCRHTGQCGISSAPGTCLYFKQANWGAARRAAVLVVATLLIGMVLAMIFIPKNVHAEEAPSPQSSPLRVEDVTAWTAGDMALQAAFLLALAVDRAQTEEFVRHPRPGANEEVGWARHFIGAHPSVGQVNGYNAACAILHTAIAVTLPKPYRTVWQSFWIGVEVNTIDSNVNAGISMRF